MNQVRGVVPALAAGVGLAVCAGGAFADDFRLFGSQVSGSVASWGLIEFQTGPITGQTDRVGRGGLMFDFDFDRAGTLYSPDGDALWTVNLESGAQKRMGDFGITPIITSIAFAPDGELFGTDNEGRNTSLYRIDLETAKAKRVGRVGDYVFGLDFAPDGTLYGASGEIFTIDPVTGKKGRTVIGFGPFITALDYGADGVFRGVETDFDTYDTLWDINVEEGVLTRTATIDELEVYALASIPAPGALVVFAMAAIAGRRGRGGAGVTSRARCR